MQTISAFAKTIQHLIDERARLRIQVDDIVDSHERCQVWDKIEDLDRRIGHTFFWYSLHAPSSITAVVPSEEFEPQTELELGRK